MYLKLLGFRLLVSSMNITYVQYSFDTCYETIWYTYIEIRFMAIYLVYLLVKVLIWYGCCLRFFNFIGKRFLLVYFIGYGNIYKKKKIQKCRWAHTLSNLGIYIFREEGCPSFLMWRKSYQNILIDNKLKKS